MAKAQAGNIVLRAVAESTWGTTPTDPALIPMRFVSESLRHTKGTRLSETMRADRQRLYLFETAQDVAGDVNVEFAPNEWCTLLAGALGCSAVIPTTADPISVDFSASGKTITRASGSFVTDGWVAGMWCLVKDAADANNNRAWRVNTVAALVLTVDDPDSKMADETADSVTLKGCMYKSGTTLKSWTFEKDFTADIASEYHAFTGVRVNEWELNATAREIITARFGLIGRYGGGAVTLGSGSRGTTYATSSPITASAHVAEIQEGGNVSYATKSAITCGVRSFRLLVNNNLRAVPEVGAKIAEEILPGWHDVTGTMECYFENDDYVDKILAHEASMIRIQFTDATGAGFIVTLPEVYYEGEMPVAAGANQDVIVPLNFRALRDSTEGCTVQVDCLGTTFTV